jgi:lipid-A-disaccharide synthase
MPLASFFGLGGQEMEREGQRRLVRAEDVAHMGITEVLRHAPYIYSQYRRLVRGIERGRPDLAILIDFPDVNFRLAKHLRRLGIPVVYLVSPQLWAWKRGRLRWVQERVTKMLVIFPFEAEFYRNRDVDAEFIGHPLAALPLPSITREAYAAHYKLDPERPWIALLPGSRWKEVTANLPAMVEMASRLPFPCEYILPVASTIDRARLQEFVKGWITFRPATTTTPLPYIHLVPDAREALHHARASVVASGTATVQAAVIGNPFVVVYRVSALTFAVAKQLVEYPPEIPVELDDDGNLPIAMVNLVAGRRVVPELLQSRFNADDLAGATLPLIGETNQRAQMVSDLAEVRERLLPPGVHDPIARAAEAILQLLPQQVPIQSSIP